jgi:tetratricopeptide (TPR) repeat protein
MAARACALPANPDGDLALAQRLAERAVQAAPKNVWFLHTLALVHYRSGRWAPALQRLREALSADPRLADDPTWGGRYLNWLLLALAHHRLGEADEAKRRLEQAIPPLVPWIAADDVVEYQLLRREARQVVR